MTLTIPYDSKTIKYNFRFNKKHIYKKREEVNLETEGITSLLIKATERFEDSLEYLFHSDKFVQKGVKDPLIFNPVKWIYNLKLNATGIDSKEDLRLTWNKYRDKYRRQDNLVSFKLLESLYFTVPLGMEYATFSNSPYLLFFINLLNKDIEKETVIKGLDFLLMPMSIPVNTTFQCIEINKDNMELNGWLSLDEEKLGELLRQKKFSEHARSYHYSKDFNLDSKIKVIIDTKTSSLFSASFDLEIKGEGGKLHEVMKYEIKRNSDSIILEDDDSKIIKGRYRIIDPY